MVELEAGKIYTIEYRGTAVLIVPKSEYECETEDFDGTYDAVWHIASNPESIALCNYTTKGGEWLVCTRIAPVTVCEKCLKIEAELDKTGL